MQTLSFRNGDEMPILGLGTWKSAPGEVYEAVKVALQAGYRHIDCALIYGNEAEVGRALTESFEHGVVDREDVWVTSKLWNDAHAPDDVRPALEETLSDLQLDTIDLYLMHWPVAHKPGVGMPQSPDDLFSLQEQPLAETWAAMEDLVDDGLAHHIGVSNFSIPKLQGLLEDAERYAPEMNQIELHPYLQQPKMIGFAKAHDVHLTAYSPLGSSDRPDAMKDEDEPVLLEDETIAEIADEHDATPAQVLISWAIHRGTAVIPKSVNEGRIKENLAAAKVDLTDANMKTIAQLDRERRYVDGAMWTMDGSPYTIANLWDE
jgi:alcohol dehydrogenase (NADP+)